MDVVYAFILGIVEGVSEFLPISSTGHLILAQKLLGVPVTEFWKSFDIAIQLGAILAILVLYGKRFVVEHKLIWCILVAFAPTAVIGLVVYPFVKQVLLGSTLVVIISLFLGGIGIIMFEWWYARRIAAKPFEVSAITLQQALLIGVAQSVAVIPGVSRSAATIIGGLALGLDRRTITEFSFLLAVPTMAAATGLDLLKTGFNFSAHEYLLLMTGFVAAFGVALITVRWFTSFVASHTFAAFGWYRVILVALWLAYMY